MSQNTHCIVAKSLLKVLIRRGRGRGTLRYAMGMPDARRQDGDGGRQEFGFA